MPAPLSAGIVLWRPSPAPTGAGAPMIGGSPADPAIEVLLIHAGGPHWAKRDVGWWSIPKGAPEAGEEPLAAAEREFHEELGTAAPEGGRIDLGEIVQRAGKHVRAWAVAGDLDATQIESSTFSMEWPPHSRQLRTFPEVDRAAWFAIAEARRMILAAQAPFLDRLAEALTGDQPPSPATPPQLGPAASSRVAWGATTTPPGPPGV